MKAYTRDCYSLYEGEDNVQNYLILKKISTGRVLIFDWDLSADEVDAIVRKFEEVGLTENDLNNTDWDVDFNTHVSGMHTIKQLA